jgi:TPR repeat protein
MTGRSFLPVMIAGGFAVALLIVLVVFVFGQPDPVGPTQEELAADYAKGLQYERGDTVTMDYAQAMTWYRKAADAGYPPAEQAVGIMTMAGRGLVKDAKGATEWFRRAAEHGLPEAQVQLAGDTLSGIATADGKPDKVEAMKWLLLGAEKMPDPLSKQVAINTRETLGKQMTPQELGEAELRAEGWQKQHAPPE